MMGTVENALVRRWGWLVRRFSAVAVAGAGLLAAGACATAGATYGSGVGDKLLDEAPYYAGRGPSGEAKLGHLPIAYQRGASQEAIFEPKSGSGSAIQRLLAAMNAHLDSLGASTRLETNVSGQAPDVQFGCERVPAGECDHDSRDVSVQGYPWMRLAVGRPSQSWTEEVGRALEVAGAERALVITLELGDYWVHQKNLLGTKVVRLGTEREQGLPWLSSLDDPVQVLQLTGAVVDRDGRALRIGAEGLSARNTPLLASAVGARALIDEAAVEELLTARRTDLPGQPLVWSVALENLVEGLTGRAAARSSVSFRRH